MRTLWSDFSDVELGRSDNINMTQFCRSHPNHPMPLLLVHHTHSPLPTTTTNRLWLLLTSYLSTLLWPVKKEPVTTASAASPSTLTTRYAVKSTTTTPTTPTYFPFVYVHPTPTTYHLPPRRDLYNYLVLHTSLLCPVPLHTPYLTCSSTTTTWTTTSDEQHVKPQNHTVIVSKLQRSIVTFYSTEDRKRKEKSSVIEPIPWVKTSYVIQSIRL